MALLGQCYSIAGRPDEGIAALEDAVKLNPFNPHTWANYAVIGFAHFTAGRLREAIEAAGRALVGRPNMITANLVVIAAHVERNDLDKARELKKALIGQRRDFCLDTFMRMVSPVADPHMQRLRDAFERISV